VAGERVKVCSVCEECTGRNMDSFIRCVVSSLLLCCTHRGWSVVATAGDVSHVWHCDGGCELRMAALRQWLHWPSLEVMSVAIRHLSLVIYTPHTHCHPVLIHPSLAVCRVEERKRDGHLRVQVGRSLNNAVQIRRCRRAWRRIAMREATV
jgi:hypothetical protein